MQVKFLQKYSLICKCNPDSIGAMVKMRAESMPREIPEDDSTVFATEVCWHYYVNGLTQAEVAKQLDTTRLRVNQAIQRAKSLGIVQVQIDSPFTTRSEMQEAVRKELGIKRAIIVPARRDPYDYHGAVGAGLASLISERIRTGAWRSIGVSWGLTLEHMIQRLPRQSQPELEVVSLLGGTSHGATFNTFGIASGLAERLGARYSLLIAPTFLSAGIDRDMFLSQEILIEHFHKFENLDASILTASDISSKSFLIANGLPGDISARDLSSAGAIGDVLGWFLDREGRSIDHPLNTRSIGIALETLERIPEKILAAAGIHKVGIIRAAAKRGLIDTLLTDDVTGEALTSGK